MLLEQWLIYILDVLDQQSLTLAMNLKKEIHTFFVPYIFETIRIILNVQYVSSKTHQTKVYLFINLGK